MSLLWKRRGRLLDATVSCNLGEKPSGSSGAEGWRTRQLSHRCCCPIKQQREQRKTRTPPLLRLQENWLLLARRMWRESEHWRGTEHRTWIKLKTHYSVSYKLECLISKRFFTYTFLLASSRGHNALPNSGKTVKPIWLWAGGRGGAFIVFATAAAGCTSSAMTCYCLCSRSRLALLQLEDNDKLCLTEVDLRVHPLVFFFLLGL